VVKNGNIDPERVAKVTYLHEFDREIQCPTWGYPTEYAYYRDASSADSVTAIRIPTFAIHAEDDPVSHHPLLTDTTHG
jgi:predicted alpha/beta-fold hydrolase